MAMSFNEIGADILVMAMRGVLRVSDDHVWVEKSDYSWNVASRPLICAIVQRTAVKVEVEVRQSGALLALLDSEAHNYMTHCRQRSS